MTAQAVATLAADDGSTVSHASYLPPSNVRHHQPSSPEFVRKPLPLCFRFYTGSAPRGSTGLSAGLDAGLNLSAGLSLSTGLRVGLSPDATGGPSNNID